MQGIRVDVVSREAVGSGGRHLPTSITSQLFVLEHGGIRVDKERVRTLMSPHGVRARGRRKFKATTDSDYKLPVVLNLLDQTTLRTLCCRLRST